MQNQPLFSIDTKRKSTKSSEEMMSSMMLLLQRRVLPSGVRKQSETLIIVDDVVSCMNKTCIHDLKPNRTIQSIAGMILRSYPLSMKHARGRWILFRKIILEDDSGWVVVKVWGPIATDLLRGQKIRLEKTYCFEQNGEKCLTLGINTHLKICTQA